MAEGSPENPLILLAEVRGKLEKINFCYYSMAPFVLFMNFPRCALLAELELEKNNQSIRARSFHEQTNLLVEDWVAFGMPMSVIKWEMMISEVRRLNFREGVSLSRCPLVIDVCKCKKLKKKSEGPTLGPSVLTREILIVTKER